MRPAVEEIYKRWRDGQFHDEVEIIALCDYIVELEHQLEKSGNLAILLAGREKEMKNYL
jgi:hypothetical protein